MPAKAIRNGLIIIAVMLAMVWGRAYWQGSQQYDEGEKNFAAGRYNLAITNYATSIHMYTPLGGYVDKSAQRLWEIGERYEKAGQYDWALIAYRELKSSFYAVRSFYTPHKDWIERSEDKIREILAIQQSKEEQAGKRKE